MAFRCDLEFDLLFISPVSLFCQLKITGFGVEMTPNNTFKNVELESVFFLWKAVWFFLVIFFTPFYQTDYNAGPKLKLWAAAGQLNSWFGIHLEGSAKFFGRQNWELDIPSLVLRIFWILSRWSIYSRALLFEAQRDQRWVILSRTGAFTDIWTKIMRCARTGPLY